MSTRLLFVCSGNICRSPLACALAAKLGDERQLSLEVDSAGTLNLVDRPAARNMIRVAREIGVDLTDHRSKGLTAELIDTADIVAVMETAHAIRVRELAPHAPVEKVLPMGPLVGKAQIDDPIKAWTLGPYRRARDEIQRAVEELLRALP